MPFESARRAGLIALAAFAGATLFVYVVSGLVTASSVGGWYQTLNKPSFNPPDRHCHINMTDAYGHLR